MNPNTVSVTLTVDLSKVTLDEMTRALDAFLKATGQSTFVVPQKALIAVNPETGFIPDPSKVVDPEEALKTAYKVNPELSTFDPERHGKTGKKVKKVSTRAPLTDVEKAIIRIRLLKGKLAHATDKATKAELQAKIEAYEDVVAQDKKDGDAFLNQLATRGSKTAEPKPGKFTNQLPAKRMIDPSELIMLYDTHGMPPDVVQNIAKKENNEVSIPPNFDSMIAGLHSYEKPEEEKLDVRINFPQTYALYYADHYTKEFDATIIWKQTTKRGTEVILDKTAFYPEGGGQPADKGILIIHEKPLQVIHVEKVANSIIHILDHPVNVGDTTHGKIDWDYR